VTTATVNVTQITVTSFHN